MDVLTYATTREMTVPERLWLKDHMAALFREATGTEEEIGVDRVERDDDGR